MDSWITLDDLDALRLCICKCEDDEDTLIFKDRKMDKRFAEYVVQYLDSCVQAHVTLASKMPSGEA